MNEIFDPDRVDEIYALKANERHKILEENRPTNYSVVRPELLARLYELMYQQRLRDPGKDQWQFQIQVSRELCAAAYTSDGKVTLRFDATKSRSSSSKIVESGFDLVVLGSGYVRNEHVQLLKPFQHLMEEGFSSVERNYRLKLNPKVVATDCGIWLQGCCEASHGVSHTRQLLFFP